MRLSIRAKLTAIAAFTALAFASLLAVSAWLGWRNQQNLADVERRMVPKLELGPRLLSDFEHLRLNMERAVGAQDPAALDDTLQQRNQLIAVVAGAVPVLSAADAAAIRHAITAYHASAYDVARRMIRGEGGESLVNAQLAMQAEQHSAESLIRRAAGLEQSELAAGFAAVREGSGARTRYTLAIGLVTLGLIVTMSVWLGRGMLGTLAALSRGMARFATGEFGTPIPVTRDDELGSVTRDANAMARALLRSDWTRASLAGLSDTLRAELEPGEVARRAVAFLCQRVGAVAGVVYLDGESGELRPAASFGAAPGLDGDAAAVFRPGLGLVGRAALEDDLSIIEDVPAGYFSLRSGLGKGDPRSLVLLPLRRGNASVGVLELAFLEPCPEERRQLLRASQEIIVISLEIARSRTRLGQLLTSTRELADRLAAQEEELRANNRELTDQQDELRRANDELEAQRQALTAQNVELEDARDQLATKAAELARASSYKSQFLANMSHELRTPLNSMLLLSHLLSENEGQNLTEKQIEYAKTIHAAGKDLLGLINQVLDLAKIEAGRQEIEPAEVVLADLVGHLTRLFAATAKQRGLAFHTELDPALPATFVTDRQRIERILVNLLGNALKFTERGAVALRIRRPTEPVRLGTREFAPERTLAFAVSDTGIGVPLAAQARIFAPFEQGDARADRRYGGTGLGLAIARESALLLGGDLVLESREGRGSTFTLYLPESTDARSRSRDPGRARGSTVDPTATFEDDRASLGETEDYLLVVEDDPRFAERLLELIHSRRLKALVAATGEEAIELAQARPPRGVMLDVRLPDTDGWSVMERLKRHPSTRSVPVHFISAIDGSERAFSLGAVGYLTKPASAPELVGAIRLLIQNPTTGPGRVLVVEDDAADGGSVVALLAAADIDARLVTTGHDALEALASERFGCVILDLGLPDVDGLGLLETFRSRPDLNAPPVVVHTGRSLTREEVRRIEAYTDAVILKGETSGNRLVDEVRLFVRHVRDDGAPRPGLAAAAASLPDVPLEGLRVLLADDDMRTVYAVSALLRGKGADVLVAETGREALAQLDAHPEVAVILMDIMMPEMDGYEALRRLRADPRFVRVPAVALTAKAMKGERERCLAAGASEYLTKPVDPARLLTLLGSLLGTNGHAAQRG